MVPVRQGHTNARGAAKMTPDKMSSDKMDSGK